MDQVHITALAEAIWDLLNLGRKHTWLDGYGHSVEDRAEIMALIEDTINMAEGG